MVVNYLLGIFNLRNVSMILAEHKGMRCDLAITVESARTVGLGEKFPDRLLYVVNATASGIEGAQQEAWKVHPSPSCQC